MHEGVPNPKDELTSAKLENERRRAVFLEAIQTELNEMIASERITRDAAEHIRAMASDPRLDIGFSAHPEYDAHAFIWKDIATPAELAELTSQKPAPPPQQERG